MLMNLRTEYEREKKYDSKMKKSVKGEGKASLFGRMVRSSTWWAVERSQVL
jgi:hypothetical protein